MKLFKNKKFFNFLIICFLLLPCFFLSACDNQKPDMPQDERQNQGEIQDPNEKQNESEDEYWDENEVPDIDTDSTTHNFVLSSSNNGTYIFACNDEGCEKTITFTISCEKGTDNCFSVDGNTITFTNVSEKSEYSITGEFYGNIVLNTGDNYKFELSLQNFTLTSFSECPISIESGDKVVISAKSETKNYIYDLREAIDDEDEESYKGAIHSNCDLDIQGKGELYIKSSNNNGINTKDDLNVKNLTLFVDCQDNALKGNDSVTIESGNLTLISRSGDGIKTSNSDVSDKGNQRGTIAITGGTILIYSACDGIDASYDVTIDETSASVNLEIYTDKYSKYSSEVTNVSSGIYYVRFKNTDYKYSIKYYNSETDFVWQNSSTYTSVFAGRGNFYYYNITKPSGYSKVQLYVYSSSQSQGQDSNYVFKTELLTVNSSYDTLAVEDFGGNLSCSWTNYSTTQMGIPNGMQQPTGGQDGNTDKGDYSTKGIKADNKIIISAGKITIQSYDDAIHANNDNTLENEETPLGNITISGGTLTLYSNDDGIHADGELLISNGTISISNCYEGLEGNTVTISGGNISVVAKDDGINGVATSGTCITVSGGTLYVYAGGDGLDSNSKTSKMGIVFSGGKSVIFSTSADNSGIDTENGYTYNGGYVVAVGRSGGMNKEETENCSNFSSVGKSTTMSLSKDKYLVVSDLATIKMPFSQNSLVVVLGSKSSTISQASSTSSVLDNNGVCWSKS